MYLNTSTGGDNTTEFRFAGNNSFVGTVHLNRGAITVTNANSLGAASNPLILDANNNATLGDLRFEASMTFTHPINTLTAANTNPINTNGNDVVFTGAYTGPAGLTKIGAGTLTLASASNNYTGPTTVSAGVLALGSGATLAATATTVQAAATFRVDGTTAGAVNVQAGGKLQGTGTITNTVSIAASGTLAPGNSIGTLSASAVVVSGGFDVEYNGGASGQKIDLLDVTGGLNITNATLNLINLGLDPLDPMAGPYVFATYGTLTGASFASVNNLPAGLEIDYNYNGLNQIALVPEPSAAILALAATGFLVRRRRR